MRAFVAIPINDTISRLLTDVHAAIVQADPTWRSEKWVPEENLHLTLRFLGNLPEGEAPHVGEALAAAAERCAPFDLELAGVRAVPSAGRATMMWATFADPSRGAERLAAAVLGATEPWAQEPSHKPFRAHATLVRARGRKRVSADALAAAHAAISAAAVAGETTMSVPRVMLVASTLTQRGPVYEVVSSALLGGD